MRAALYARISQSDPNVDAIGSQLQHSRALAEREGYEVVAEFTDDGISGWSGKARPGFLSLVEGIRGGRFDVIVAVAEDRFTRSAQEKLGFQADCAKAGVIWHTGSGGKVDPSTAEGKLLGTITGGIAEYESSLKADRVARSIQDRLSAGLDLGGRRAFGFDGRRTPTIRQDEAELIRLGYRMVLDGESLYAVAREWNASGIRPEGKAEMWRTQSVRHILLRPRNAGHLVVKGVDYGARLPAIVSPEDHEALTKILTNPARAPRRGPKPTLWSATGVVRCGVCGSNLSQTGTRNGRAFRCAGFGAEVKGKHPAITVERLERQLRDAALVRVIRNTDSENTDRLERDSSAHVAAVQLQLAELRRQRSLAQEMLLSPGVDVDDFKRRIADLGTQIDQAQADLDQALSADERASALAVLEGSGDVTDRWADFWDGLPVEQRRRLLRALYNSIELLPFDRSRVWRLRLDGEILPDHDYTLEER